MPEHPNPLLHGSRQAVVFDLDGTLVETAADIHAVLGEVLAERGLAAPPPRAVRGMIGDGARTLVERALAATGQPVDGATLDSLHARFRDRYADIPCRFSEPYPGARELLAGLRAAGHRLGLCTNKPQAATEALLRALRLHACFDAVPGGDLLPGGARKPDPAHLSALLARLGVPPEAAVMVGDSRNDLLAAQGLGVPCILVSFGYTDSPARELGADLVVDRLDQVPGALARIGPGRHDAGGARRLGAGDPLTPP